MFTEGCPMMESFAYSLNQIQKGQLFKQRCRKMATNCPPDTFLFNCYISNILVSER